MIHSNRLIKPTCWKTWLAAAILGLSSLPSSAALLQAQVYSRASAIDSDIASSSTAPISATASTASSNPDGCPTGSAAASADQGGWLSASSMIESGTCLDVDGRSWARVSQTLSFSNDTGANQNYFFDYTILPGSLNNITTSSYVAGSGSGYVESGYEISISLDGVALFESSANLRTGSSGTPSLSMTGQNLGGAQTQFSYIWDAYSSTLDLGVISAGQSFDLVYEVFTYVDSNYTKASFMGDAPTTVSAYFGDPNHLSSTPFAASQLSYTAVNPVNVPEPGMWLLLATGLVGLSLSRRSLT